MRKTSGWQLHRHWSRVLSRRDGHSNQELDSVFIQRILYHEHGLHGNCMEGIILDCGLCNKFFQICQTHVGGAFEGPLPPAGNHSFERQTSLAAGTLGCQQVGRGRLQECPRLDDPRLTRADAEHLGASLNSGCLPTV